MPHLRSERILITGIAGFVGSNLSRVLQARGVQVYGLLRDARSTSPGVHQIMMDLTDGAGLAAAIREIRPSQVFHLGAHVVLDRTYETARRCVDVNIHGTLNLLEALIPVRETVRRVVFMSTEEVYGAGPVPYCEDQAVAPPSPYAISKVAGEHLCAYYHRAHGLPTVVLRLATTYGPLQPTTRFIPRIIQAALAGEDIALDDGSSARDYVYIDDVVDALLRAADHDEAVGAMVNIGSVTSVTSRALVQEILALTGSTSRVHFGAISPRTGEATLWRSDIQRAASLLGWHPTVSLTEGLRGTVAYVRETASTRDGNDAPAFPARAPRNV